MNPFWRSNERASCARDAEAASLLFTLDVGPLLPFWLVLLPLELVPAPLAVFEPSPFTLALPPTALPFSLSSSISLELRYGVYRL